jgi:allophanate hydrolase
MNLALSFLRAGFAQGRLDPGAVVEHVLARDAAVADPAIWITPPDAAGLRARAETLRNLPESARGPLFGVPFAVKDNIDVAGLPTTAGCPGYAYTPERSAPVVQRLLDAGAILVGKTNLDQFATGLVGVRSPYGTPRNALAPDRVPGGSSSGSAVAVAHGIVSFALGTDTAGSGRVPAALNGIVGLKPSRGVLSAEGVVPACRSLDCVSIFTTSAADAEAVLELTLGMSDGDAYARALVPRDLPAWRGLRVGVPAVPEFFGDELMEAAFTLAVARARLLGAEIVPIDLAPFAETAALLYGGPWVAERWQAVGAFIAAEPDAVHPVTRRIIVAGREIGAADLFTALHRLEALRRRTGEAWRRMDVLLVPTVPVFPTLAELEADPVGPNTRLGTYTNFVNLLDLAAIAIPSGSRADGLPFGVSLIAPAMTDRALCGLARDWAGLVELAVVGAHLAGMPLHHELDGAPLVERTTTSPDYRLHALAGTVPPKPGLVRTTSGGAPIEVEVYALDALRFGAFTRNVPPPLAIGSVQLPSGRWVKGFVCEPFALEGAEDITAFGGWRAYRAARS